MAACFSNLRSSKTLLSSLNLLLLLLSAASLVPLFLLRAPPSPFGWALFAVSSTTLLSAVLGFSSHLTRSNLIFVSHILLLLVSSVGQALGFFSLFLCVDASISFIGSNRSPREVRVLSEIEKWAMAGMFVLGSVVLVFECLVQSWWVNEYKETKRAHNFYGTNRRMGRVRVESVVESEAKETEETTESEFEQCL